MTKTLAAVVLDMDGLLLDSEQLYLHGFRHAQAEMGLDPDDTLFHGLIGMNAPTCQARLRDVLGDAASGFWDLWGAEAGRLLSGPVPLKPSIAESLETLAARGVPRIVATSTAAATARARLDRSGIGHLLPDLIGGDQVANGKPAPDIYLAAATHLGLPSDRCAAFEDSANGVRAAVAAGMVVTQVPDLVAPSEALLTLGHQVAPDLATGLRALALI